MSGYFLGLTVHGSVKRATVVFKSLRKVWRFSLDREWLFEKLQEILFANLKQINDVFCSIEEAESRHSIRLRSNNEQCGIRKCYIRFVHYCVLWSN